MQLPRVTWLTLRYEIEKLTLGSQCFGRVFRLVSVTPLKEAATGVESATAGLDNTLNCLISVA